LSRLCLVVALGSGGPPRPTLLPYPTLFRSGLQADDGGPRDDSRGLEPARGVAVSVGSAGGKPRPRARARPAGRRLGRTRASVARDRKSTRLNSSHVKISYAVFCLKKKHTER